MWLMCVYVHVSVCVCNPPWSSTISPVSRFGGLQQTAGSEVCHQTETMEVLEHRSSSDVGGGLRQSSLELEVGDTRSCGSQGRAGGLGLDVTAERLQDEVMEEKQDGSLEVFHPGEAAEERASSVIVAEALRCQVKITTRRSLHLRIANHTARDVYVRLVGHGGRIAGTSIGQQRNTLEQSKMKSQTESDESGSHPLPYIYSCFVVHL